MKLFMRFYGLQPVLLYQLAREISRKIRDKTQNTKCRPILSLTTLLYYHNVFSDIVSSGLSRIMPPQTLKCQLDHNVQ